MRQIKLFKNYITDIDKLESEVNSFLKTIKNSESASVATYVIGSYIIMKVTYSVKDSGG